ncbi:hypothetical protein ACTNFI_00005, partial [Coxiella burnetii]|uniref:hypothetical protein n=1 Tax=Coxiella burnetii TaxID=777 RepID=UPI003FA5BBE1
INTQYFNIFHGPSPFFENRNSMLAHYDAVFKGWVHFIGLRSFGAFLSLLAGIPVTSAVKVLDSLSVGRRPTHGNDGHLISKNHFPDNDISSVVLKRFRKSLNL